MPKVIQVIESETTRGKGTIEDHCRTVKQYFTLDGEFLAEEDPTFNSVTVDDLRAENRDLKKRLEVQK